MILLWIALGWTALAGLVTLALYGVDKRRAVRNRSGTELRRVPERTLHLWELLGGWPGGLLARRLFSHKSNAKSKSRFVWTSRAIIAVHLAAWATVAYFVLVR